MRSANCFPDPIVWNPGTLVTKGRHFVRNDGSGEVVLLGGSDVVVKGPPWIPATSGSTSCKDRWFTNFTCYTFNEADALHVRAQGWNFIRLGVVWAGGQPTNEPKLADDFVQRLHDILDLCHKHGIHVLLDVRDPNPTPSHSSQGGHATEAALTSFKCDRRHVRRLHQQMALCQ